MNAEGLTREECSFLRGAAALFVVVAHYCQWYGAQTDAGILCILLSKLGRYGVSIFFALSGYGLMCSAAKGIDVSFLSRRFQNVYVPYLFLTGIIRLFDGTEWGFGAAARWALAIDSWFVFVILLFYILFYFVWRYCKNKMFLIWAGILLISAALGVCTKDSAWYSCNFSFGIGIAVKAYESQFAVFLKKYRFFPLIFLFVCFGGSAVIYMLAMNGNQAIYIGFKILASVFWTLFVFSLAVQIKFAYGKYIRRLGEASLECYLVHPFVLAIVEQSVSFGKKWEYLGIVCISVVCSIIISCFLHKTYSVLMEIYKRKRN